MAGIITTGTHPKLLWPGVYTVWGQVYNEHMKEYSDLYEERDSTRAYETGVQVTGFGIAPVKPEGQSGSFAGEVQGIISNYTHIAYALGYIVTKEEIEDNQYKEVATNRARANAFSMNQTVETVAAFLYNNGFNNTYYSTGDGVALLSNAHVQALGGTYSNVLTPAADLCEAAAEDLVIQIALATNDAGLKINLLPESLHIAPGQWFNANRIFKSVLQSNTASNNINVLKATNAFPKGIKMNHYFTNPNAWFVRTNVQEGMTMFWRNRPEFDKDNDFSTKNALAMAYMRLSVGCTDPRGIYGVNGA